MAYVAEKIMPSRRLIYFPTTVRAGIEFTKASERLIPMKITTFGRKTLQKSKGQFSKKKAYYSFVALITILWGAGITPSIANDNNAASSSVKSATQATSNALSSIIFPPSPSNLFFLADFSLYLHNMKFEVLNDVHLKSSHGG